MPKRIILSSAIIICSCAAAVEKNLTMENDAMLEISTYSTDHIIPHIPLLEEWMKRDYIHYPYLWAPSGDECCMDMFVKEKNALVSLVKRQGEVMGVAAGIPFDSEPLQDFFQCSMIDLAKAQGFDPEKIMYMSFFLTSPEHRNEENIVASMYDAHVAFAKRLGKTQICYWADSGRVNHPLKPKKLVEVEPWGYAIHGFRSMNIKLDQTWSTLQPDGSVGQEVHTIEFYIKDL